MVSLLQVFCGDLVPYEQVCQSVVTWLVAFLNAKTINMSFTVPDVCPHGRAEEEDLTRDIDHGGVETVDDGQGGALPGVGSVVAETGYLQCQCGTTSDILAIM